jgi:hypothetical protein
MMSNGTNTSFGQLQRRSGHCASMKGIHHESKQALARRETPRGGSITH